MCGSLSETAIEKDSFETLDTVEEIPEDSIDILQIEIVESAE